MPIPGQRLVRSYRARKMLRSARVAYGALGLDLPKVRISHSVEARTPHEMHLVRRAGGLDVLVDLESFRHSAHSMKNRACAHWHWFAQAPAVARIVCDVSDGHLGGHAQFSYASYRADVIPVPDYYFFRDRGYGDSDRLAQSAPDWDARSDEIIWRGRPNNLGLFTTDPAMADTAGVMQRMRMALKCIDNPEIDFRFVGGRDTLMQGALETAGLIGDPIPQNSWAGRKFAIDIDGFASAWDNLLRRLKMGCCMLKVDSPFGFRQWYYDQLVPFEHFVPIKADLSDLNDQIDWVRTHQDKARAIARAGQAVAAGLTFESETKEAGRLIRMHAG